jgi:hypothetical protein
MNQQVITVRINENARERHAYPDWPWYLGKFEPGEWWQNRTYIPKYEGREFKVVQGYHMDQWQLLDKNWAQSNLGNEIAWIDKEDCTVVAPAP